MDYYKSFLDVSFEYEGQKRTYMHLDDIDRLSHWDLLEHARTHYRVHIVRAPLYLGGKVRAFVYPTITVDKMLMIDWDNMQSFDTIVVQHDYPIESMINAR